MEDFDIDFSLGGISDITKQFMMRSMLPYYKAREVQADFNAQDKSGGYKRYELELHGQGISSLQETGLGGEAMKMALEDLGSYAGSNGIDANMMNQLGVHVVALGGNQYRLQMDSVPSIEPKIFRLHAGRIISSNADQVRLGTATWKNPQHVEVIFTAVNPRSTTMVVLGGAVGLGVVSLGTWLLIKRKPLVGSSFTKQRTRPVTPPRSGKPMRNPHIH